MFVMVNTNITVSDYSGEKTMTYDELYASSRAFFETHTAPKQIAILDSHEKCSDLVSQTRGYFSRKLCSPTSSRPCAWAANSGVNPDFA